MGDLISVIIPVYNVEPYLRKCLDSVIVQTHKNLEIILVDDGSTDGSGTLCDEYSQYDPRIKVVHQDNQGLSVARNTGMNMANGMWIAFLDSDDWIEETMYETLYKNAIKYNADISSCNTRFTSEKDVQINVDKNIEVLTQDEMIIGLRNQKIVRFEVWNKLWKRDLIGETRFKKGQVCEDIYFDHIVFLKCKKFVYTYQKLHNYLIQRPGNTNSSFKIGKMEGLNELHIFVEDLIAKGKVELSQAIAAYSSEFAISMFLSAKKSKQPKSLIKSIKSEFQYFKNIAKKSKYINKKTIYLFSLSPAFFNWVSKIKSRYQ